MSEMMRRLVVVFLVLVVILCGCKTASRVVEVTATPLVTRATVETKIPAVVASATPKPPTPTRTFTAAPTPAVTQDQTKVATATATLVPTVTPTVIPLPTKTDFPWRWKVEVIVVGLPAEELRYLRFKFTDSSGRELFPLEVQGNLYFLNGEPALVEAVGSADGKHPWADYWVKGDNNPKRVQVNIYTGTWTVKFDFGKK